MRSSPASYGSRDGGAESGRKTTGRGTCCRRGADPARISRGWETRVGRATAWGQWQLNREAGSSGERVTGGRLACSRWDHCQPPDWGCGSGAESDWERRDRAYETVSSSEALTNYPRPLSSIWYWVRAPRPLQTQATKLIPIWTPQAGAQLAFGEGSSVGLFVVKDIKHALLGSRVEICSYF